MLETIGVAGVAELFATIPDELRLKSELELPVPLSEMEVRSELDRLAAQVSSNDRVVCFAGCGAYDHYIPAVVDTIVSRSEFYTAYTPYQAEVSQGTLQSIYEFQSLVCRLFELEVANASMYDCASALAETAHMARDITRRPVVLVSDGVNPLYRAVAHTYAQGLNIPLEPVRLAHDATDLAALKGALSDRVAAVVVQHPNFFGTLEPVREISRLAHEAGALLISAVDPVSTGILAPPGAYGADIALAEGQSLGVPLSFGGPYLGLLATRKKHVRSIPGRLVARTTDVEGKTGYVLALQTREQHIRRERASSNICTNQALCALAAGVYLAWMGPDGMRQVAEQSLAKSHYLARAIGDVPGYAVWNTGPFFKEFVVRSPIPAARIVEAGLGRSILCGVDLGRFSDEWKNLLLVAVTEKRTKSEMDAFAALLAKECAG